MMITVPYYLLISTVVFCTNLLPQDDFLCIIFPKPWAQVWILMYYHCLSKHIHEEMIQENDCGELTLAKLETAMSINIK